MSWNAICVHEALTQGAVLYVYPATWTDSYRLPHQFNAGDDLAIEFMNNARVAAKVQSFMGGVLRISTANATLDLKKGSMANAPIVANNTPYEAWIVQ